MLVLIMQPGLIYLFNQLHSCALFINFRKNDDTFEIIFFDWFEIVIFKHHYMNNILKNIIADPFHKWHYSIIAYPFEIFIGHHSSCNDHHLPQKHDFKFLVLNKKLL